MGLSDLLSNVPLEVGPHLERHFERVSAEASPELIGHGLAAAFRSPQTPSFAQMLENLFVHSDSLQQAELLNLMIETVGPAALTAAGGALATLLDPGARNLTTEQASAVRPEQVREIATEIERQSPEVVDRVARFYARHPTVIKTIGAAALAVVLAQMKSRLDRR